MKEYNDIMKKWPEESLTIEELSEKINKIRSKIKELENKGPQPVDPGNPYYNPEYFRQTLLTLNHRHLQELMALRAKKFKQNR